MNNSWNQFIDGVNCEWRLMKGRGWLVPPLPAFIFASFDLFINSQIKHRKAEMPLALLQFLFILVHYLVYKYLIILVDVVERENIKLDYYLGNVIGRLILLTCCLINQNFPIFLAEAAKTNQLNLVWLVAAAHNQFIDWLLSRSFFNFFRNNEEWIVVGYELPLLCRSNTTPAIPQQLLALIALPFCSLIKEKTSVAAEKEIDWKISEWRRNWLQLLVEFVGRETYNLLLRN